MSHTASPDLTPKLTCATLSPRSGQLILIARSATSPGQRQHNEDSHLIMPDVGLYVVCDGMGGHASGEVASRLAVEAIRHAFAAGHPDDSPPALTPQRLREAMALANAQILEQGRGMGTKLVALAQLAAGSDHLCLTHIGDSRAYRLRDGQLTQLTVDHSLYEELRAKGAELPMPQEFQFRHVITRALGISDPSSEATMTTLLAEPGDLYMLCSDGLFEQLDPERLALLLSHPHEDLAQRLVHAALEAGSSDNITVIVIHATAQDAT